MSCFITALPYFIYGPATHFVQDELLSSSSSSNQTNNFQMCHLEHFSSENCTDNRGSTVWPAVILFFVGNFIRGIGFATYYVIAMPFVDDNVPKKDSPLFLSVMQCILLIGPAGGFFFSAFCLRLYEDPWSEYTECVKFIDLHLYRRPWS